MRLTSHSNPGAKPSVTAGVRWQSDNGWDSIYAVADAINDGTWGYNNLQRFGITRRINSQWHFSWETYTLSQKNVLNITDPAGIIANVGFPFTPANGIFFNAPNFAVRHDPNAITRTARVFTSLIYLNYQFSRCSRPLPGETRPCGDSQCCRPRETSTIRVPWSAAAR